MFSGLCGHITAKKNSKTPTKVDGSRVRHCKANNNTFSIFVGVLCAIFVLLPLFFSVLCALWVLKIVHRTQLLLLRQVVSIGDQQLSTESKRYFRQHLFYAILHITTKTFVTVALVMPFWMWLIAVGEGFLA